MYNNYDKYLPILSIFFLAFLLVPTASADVFTYQEDANYTTTSGEWSSAGNIYDGSWTTSSGCGTMGIDGYWECYYYFDYNKTENSVGAILLVKDDVGATPHYPSANMTIPSGCWDEYEDTIKLRLMLHYDYDSEMFTEMSSITYWCYDGGWSEIYTLSETQYDHFYEEGIYWNETGGATPEIYGITELSPVDNYNTSNTSPSHQFKVEGTNETYSCTLYYNNTSYDTNLSVYNSTLTTLAVNTSLSDGSYEWWVNCSFNPENESEHRQINIDSTPPQIIIYSPTNTTYTSTNITLQVSADETIDTWTYSLNGASNQTFIPNTTIIGTEGANSITIYANDSLDNLNSSTAYFSIDTTSPSFTAASPTNTTYISTNVSLQVSTGESIDTWWYSLNGGANTEFTPNITITATEGANHIIVYANDSLGNEGNQTVYFSVDTIPPSFNITSPMNTTYSDSNISLNVSTSDSVDTWWYALNGGNATIFAPNTTFIATEGSNNIIVYANDSVGNEANSSVSFTYTASPSVTGMVAGSSMFGILIPLAIGLGLLISVINTFAIGYENRDPKEIMIENIGIIIVLLVAASALTIYMGM